MKKAFTYVLLPGLLILAFVIPGKSAEPDKIIMYSDQPAWEVKVFPNPVKDVLNIQYTLSEKKDIILEIRDITGKKVMEEKLEELTGSSETSVTLSELREGIYFLKFYSADKKYFKIIKIQKL